MRDPAEQAAPGRRDPYGDLWQHDPDACCQVRKTAALEVALVGFDAWITGHKRFQDVVRWQLPTIEPQWSRGRIRINPLAPWSAANVERHRALHHLPKDPLADRGYRSIGCVPCTRPVSAHEPQRTRRWVGLGQVRVRHSPDGKAF